MFNSSCCIKKSQICSIVIYIKEEADSILNIGYCINARNSSLIMKYAATVHNEPRITDPISITRAGVIWKLNALDPAFAS